MPTTFVLLLISRLFLSMVLFVLIRRQCGFGKLKYVNASGPSSSNQAANSKKIFEGSYFLPRGRRFDIHPDGKSFIMLQRPDAGPQEQKLFVIENFTEELKQLVPVGKD